MSKRAALIEKYAADLKDKLGIDPDLALLTKVTIGCGPSIYNADAETVAGTDPAELDRIRKNFLIGKLGLTDGPALADGIDKVIADYGRSNRNKYRAVVYYLLALHFDRASVYA